MSRAICIDTTVLLNFAEEENFFLEFFKHFPDKEKIVYKEEVEKFNLSQLISRLDNVCLINENHVSLEKFFEFKLQYPQLDDGEACLIAYAVENNGCFLSDDGKARKVGKENNILPCCLNQLGVGGTIGILNFLVKEHKIKDHEAKACFERIKQRGNYLPQKYPETFFRC